MTSGLDGYELIPKLCMGFINALNHNPSTETEVSKGKDKPTRNSRNYITLEKMCRVPSVVDNGSECKPKANNYPYLLTCALQLHRLDRIRTKIFAIPDPEPGCGAIAIVV